MVWKDALGRLDDEPGQLVVEHIRKDLPFLLDIVVGVSKKDAYPLRSNGSRSE